MEERHKKNDRWVIALSNLIFISMWNCSVQEPLIVLLPLLECQCVYYVFSCGLMQTATKGRFLSL